MKENFIISIQKINSTDKEYVFVYKEHIKGGYVQLVANVVACNCGSMEFIEAARISDPDEVVSVCTCNVCGKNVSIKQSLSV